VGYTPEMLAKLEAQRAYFASDDHIRREVQVWTDATPAERLAEVARMCAAAAPYAEHYQHAVDADPAARFPPDTLELFARLRGAR